MDNQKPLNSLPDYLDHLLEGCLIVNESSDVVYMNKQAAEHFRVDRNLCIGGKLNNIFKGKNKNHLFNRIEKNVTGKKSVLFEEKIAFTYDDFLWLKIRVKPIPQGVMLLTVDITAQKEAENLFRERDEEYHKSLDELNAVINALPGIVTVVDTEFRVLHANEQAYKKFGQSCLEEILGKTCYSVRKKLKKPCPQCNLVKAFNDGKVKVRLSTPEEEKMLGFSTKAYAIPLFDKNGKLWGGVEVIMDIDDIRKAGVELEKLNSELQEKNTFIQTILDNLPIGIALNAIQSSKITYVNKKFEEIYGWSRNDIDSIHDFFEKVFSDPEYRAQIREQVLSDIKSGDPSRMHWENLKVTHRDGTKGIVNAVNIPLPEQNTMVSTVTDISGLKEIEKELKDINELLSKFILNSPIYTFIKEVTPDGSKVIVASENFIDMTGMPGSKMTGKTMEELFPPDFARKMTADDWQVVSNGEIIKLDEELEGRYYTTIKFPIKQGKRNLLAGYTIDITNRKQWEIAVKEKNDALLQANRELKRAKRKAEESDRLKSAFLANMSHEIRTPMNSIMGFASLLPEEDSMELLMNYAKIIVSSSEQLVHIIDDIVLYSRLQTRLLSYAPSQFIVQDLLSDVKQMFNLPDYKKGVELIIDSGDLLNNEITSDYEKVKQIFTNLVSNAFKYTPKGTITIGYSEINNKTAFFVKDTGVGIPKGEKEKIFDRFYRGSNVCKGNIGGTGLGLSIVKELVELIKGEIWVESIENSGTAFFFSV
ncbi:MAG: PAS domain-containing sensor histidine kinase [Prolixibacteraceae bacterium]|nr:PAS domain-containing sensor histidine kinase [Prolixibacteraceae bacterium]